MFLWRKKIKGESVVKDLKTYFFIAGVAHVGKNKEWMRTEDVNERIHELKESRKILDSIRITQYSQLVEKQKEIGRLKRLCGHFGIRTD